MAYSIYALPYGVLYGTADGQPSPFKLNTFTGVWEPLSAPFHAWDGQYAHGTHNKYPAPDFAPYGEAPMMIGEPPNTHAILPGRGDHVPVLEMTVDEWVHVPGNPPTDSVRSLLRAEPYDPEEWYASSVEPDKEIAGGYYFVGGYNVARWDGHSASAPVIQFDDPIDDVGWVVNNLYDPNTGPWNLDLWNGTYPTAPCALAFIPQYMFYQAGYYWFLARTDGVPIYISPHNAKVSVQGLFRCITRDVGPSSVDQIGAGSLIKMFSHIPLSTAVDGDEYYTFMLNWYPPVKWHGKTFICLRKGVMLRHQHLGVYDDQYVGSDHGFVYVVDAAGEVTEALRLSWLAPFEVDAVSLGILYHPETDAMYAFHITSNEQLTNRASGNGTTHAVGRTLQMRVNKCISEDGHTWQEVATIFHQNPTEAPYGDWQWLPAFTSDENNLYISWYTEGIYDGTPGTGMVIHKLNLSNYTWSQYDAGYMGGNLMFVKFKDHLLSMRPPQLIGQ